MFQQLHACQRFRPINHRYLLLIAAIGHNNPSKSKVEATLDPKRRRPQTRRHPHAMDGLALLEAATDNAADDRDDGVRVASLAAVEELRRELRASLRAVENNLRDAGAVTSGYDAAYFLNQSDARESHKQHPPLFRVVSERLVDGAVARSAAQRFDFDPPDNSRASWKILPLGRAMCLEVWYAFDEDCDGAWSHKEFVEYMAAMEQRDARPDMHAIADSGETWRMFVSDSCELNVDLCMTFPGFVAYRESIEAEHPLQNDLEMLNIAVEWPDLAKIRRSKAAFAEYAAAGESSGMVDITRLPFIMAECGLLATRAEIQEAIDQQRRLDKCLRSIRNLKKALRLFGYYQCSDLAFTGPGTTEDPRVCKSSFRRLLFSGWSPSKKSVRERLTRRTSAD